MEPLCEWCVNTHILILPDVQTFAAFHFNNLFNEVGKKPKFNLSVSLSLQLYMCFLRVKSRNHFKYYFTEKLLVSQKLRFTSEGAIFHILLNYQ